MQVLRQIENYGLNLDHFRVHPGHPADITAIDTRGPDHLDKQQGEQLFLDARRRMVELQEVFHADGRFALLVVLQAMDAGGKDSTIRNVFSHMDPQGVRVTSFKAPTPRELRQDFLWRVHGHCPPKGRIGIFNRSHYEDIVIVRVRNFVPDERSAKRFDHINDFERMLTDEGTRVLKFFLHISRDYQKRRLERRLNRPDKWWKFNPDDLEERRRWDDYEHAYSTAISRCSTDAAPWFIVPAERRWLRNLIVTTAVVEAMERMDLRFPPPHFKPEDFLIE